MPRDAGSVCRDINSLLNGLVSDGTITSFDTNFDSLTAALAPHVMVTADVVTMSGKPGYDPERVQRLRKVIRQKVEPILPSVIVSVRQTPPPSTKAIPVERPPGRITGAQSREARRLLGMTVKAFSQAAAVSVNAVGTFERGDGATKPETYAAIVGALKAAGVEFADGDVRLGAEALKRKRS